MISTETFPLCSLFKKRFVCPPPSVNLFRKKFTNIIKYELYITEERAKIKYLIIVNFLSLVLIERLWLNKINSRTKNIFKIFNEFVNKDF